MSRLAGIVAACAMLAPVLALGAEAVSTVAVTPERVEAYVGVLEQNGCRMSINRADAVLPDAGFDNTEETKALTEQLIAAGRARILDDELVLFGGACGAGIDYSARDRFFAGLADNGCLMTTSAAKRILPRLGVDLQEVRLLMNRMLAEGEVALSSDESTVILEPAQCEKYKGLSEAIAATVPAKPAARSRDAVRTDFLTYMATVDCTMTRSEAQIELARAGFDANDVRPVIQGLIDAGQAEMQGSDGRLTIKPEVCQ